MTEMSAEFYDTHAASQMEHALQPVWEEACRWIHMTVPITDLGCGPGGFALTLARWGYKGHYVGVDFSPASLLIARTDIEGLGIAMDYDLIQADLNRDPPWRNASISGSIEFTCFETFEHLDDDLGIIQRWVPPGHRLIFSVPNYPSEAHVRHFGGPGAVFARYAPLLHFARWSMIDLGPPRGRAVHLFDTTRRSDSWV